MKTLFLILAAVVILHLLLRLVRYFFKFPIPHFLVPLIDNPLRRRIQPPEKLPEALGADPGMRLLEVGPGNGTYTRAAGERLEERGLIVALDIEMRVAARLKNSMDAQNLRKVFPVVADVHLAPFTRQAFDAVYMVAVIGEIPGAEAAFHAFYDVLKPGGKLLFSELLLDPDYTLPRTLRVWAQKAGFEQAELHGGLLSYTVLFQRPA